MQVSFKPILEEDIDHLRDIAVKTFIHSYEHLNTLSNFNWYIQKAFTVEKLLSEIRNDESYYYFVHFGKDIVGYLKLNIGKSQTENHNDEYLEIERIYLNSNYQKKGIGRRIMTFVFEQARTLSKSKVWLGVWDQNPRAILFYEHIGFQRNGSHVFKFGDEDQVDHIMEIDVAHFNENY